ncbi:cyclic-di-AMP receptor, partial [Acinetobacter baumannii]
MKLAVCIVHGRDKNPLADAMVKAGFKFTILASHGGFLREGNATFLVGLDETELENLKA